MHATSSQILSEVIEPPIRDLPQAYNPSVWARESVRLWSTVERNLQLRSASKECLAELRYARSQAETLVEENRWFFAESLHNKRIIHGDFRPENMVIGPHIDLVVDFDMAHVSYAEIDVAYGALSFAGPRWLIGPRIWEVCHSFLMTCRRFSKDLIVSDERLDVALRWSVIKALSLSFKEEQVCGRMLLYRELLQNLSAGLAT